METLRKRSHLRAVYVTPKLLGRYRENPRICDTLFYGGLELNSESGDARREAIQLAPSQTRSASQMKARYAGAQNWGQRRPQCRDQASVIAYLREWADAA